MYLKCILMVLLICHSPIAAAPLTKRDDPSKVVQDSDERSHLTALAQKFRNSLHRRDVCAWESLCTTVASIQGTVERSGDAMALSVQQFSHQLSKIDEELTTTQEMLTELASEVIYPIFLHF